MGTARRFIQIEFNFPPFCPPLSKLRATIPRSPSYERTMCIADNGCPREQQMQPRPEALDLARSDPLQTFNFPPLCSPILSLNSHYLTHFPFHARIGGEQLVARAANGVGGWFVARGTGRVAPSSRPTSLPHKHTHFGISFGG
jgi:hypothetical protein